MVKNTQNQPDAETEEDVTLTASDIDRASEVAIASATLLGDVRDALLSEIKALPKPWQKMSEEEQGRAIHRASDIAGELVTKVVHLISTKGFSNLPVTINKFTVKDGVKIEVGAAETVENITHLAMHSGAAVLVLATPSAFMGEKEKAQTDNVGELAIPKTGPGAPSDPDAMEHLGRGNGTMPSSPPPPT